MKYSIKDGMNDIRGYFLEVLQLGIDFLRGKLDIPPHPAFNMRRFLRRDGYE